MQPTARGQAIPGSATLTISAKAGALRAEGVDVVALSVGQPDFPTPPHIVDDAVTLLQKRAAIAREQEAARAAENRRGQR